jgi:hypothetical protein
MIENEISIENAIKDQNNIYIPGKGIDLIALDNLLESKEEVGIFVAGTAQFSKVQPRIDKLTKHARICALDYRKPHFVHLDIGEIRDEDIESELNSQTLDQFRRVVYQLKRLKVIDSVGALNVNIACDIQEYTFGKKIIQFAETSIGANYYTEPIRGLDNSVIQHAMIFQDFSVKVFRRPTNLEIGSFREI